MLAKNFRKRNLEHDDVDTESSDEEERRMALEEVKLLQKQRERKPGIPALPSIQSGNGGLVRLGDKVDGDGEKEDLVLQDTFAQETAVIVEDPNMLKYVEQELAKRRGKKVDPGEKVDKDPMDELYAIPEHLKVRKRNSEESSTQWTTGIAEVNLPIESYLVLVSCCLPSSVVAVLCQLLRIEKGRNWATPVCPDRAAWYKLRNIEETEAAKKILQEKRLTGRPKSESSIPSSYSADYFHRGRDYAEKLRREHPDSYRERDRRRMSDNAIQSSESNNNNNNHQDIGGRRQAATDEFMLERFRKRERNRAMRR